MYQNLINQNPLINQFQGYMGQNPTFVPFQNNQLMSQNPHVMGNLNNLVQQQRILQHNMPMYQQQLSMAQNISNPNTPQNISNSNTISNTTTNIPSNSSQTNKKNKNSKNKGMNIIEEMLKPQIIVKDNKDVDSNYKKRETQQNKKIELEEITNAPYKIIIKDKIVTKKVNQVRHSDMLVHKATNADADKVKFTKDLKKKEIEVEKINDELKIEFNIDNYDKNKKKFDYKETFIKNLAYEQNTFDENKQDYIEFYKKKQKEAEEGQKLCDQILHNIVDEGIITKDELPSEVSEAGNTSADIDLKSIIDKLDLETSPSSPSPPSTDKVESVGEKTTSQKNTRPNNLATKTLRNVMPKREPVKRDPIKKEPVKKEPIQKEPIQSLLKEPINKELPKILPSTNNVIEQVVQKNQPPLSITSSTPSQINQSTKMQVSRTPTREILTKNSSNSNVTSSVPKKTEGKLSALRKANLSKQKK